MIFITMLLTAEHSNKCEGVFEGLLEVWSSGLTLTKTAYFAKDLT